MAKGEAGTAGPVGVLGRWVVIIGLAIAALAFINHGHTPGEIFSPDARVLAFIVAGVVAAVGGLLMLLGMRRLRWDGGWIEWRDLYGKRRVQFGRVRSVSVTHTSEGNPKFRLVVPDQKPFTVNFDLVGDGKHELWAVLRRLARPMFLAEVARLRTSGVRLAPEGSVVGWGMCLTLMALPMGLLMTIVTLVQEAQGSDGSLGGLLLIGVVLLAAGVLGVVLWWRGRRHVCVDVGGIRASWSSERLLDWRAVEEITIKDRTYRSATAEYLTIRGGGRKFVFNAANPAYLTVVQFLLSTPELSDQVMCAVRDDKRLWVALWGLKADEEDEDGEA